MRRAHSLPGVVIGCLAACHGDGAGPATSGKGVARAMDSPSAASSSPDVQLCTPRLVAEAVRRVRARLPRSGPYAVLVSGGTGRAAAATGDALRAALERDPRIRLSRVDFSQLEPVADPSTGTGHVHATGITFEPWPDLVLWVSEVDGKQRVAAHPPGADPLRPPVGDGTWVITAP